MGEFVACVDQVKADLSEYRALSHPETGVDRRALWPKTFSSKELDGLRKAEERRARQEEVAEEAKRKIEEEKLAAAAPAKKAPAKKGAVAEKPGSRGNLSSAASGDQAKRRDVIKELLK